MDNEKVLDKVRKILAKSRNNPSTEEAETALLLAQKIMAQYGITMEDVDILRMDSTPKEVVDISITDKKRLAWWQGWLARVIADNFRCKSFIRKNWAGEKRVCLIGLKQDAELAHELIGYATKAIMYFSNEYLKSISHHRSRSTTIKNSWIDGFINGLEAKFKEQVKENGWGLVLVKDPIVLDAIEKLNMKKGRASSIKTGSTAAYQNGYKQGHSFESRAGVITGR